MEIRLKNIIITSFLLICLSVYTKAQTFYKCQIRLLSSSKQVNQDSAKYFRVTKVVIDDKKIIITKNDKKQLIVSTDTVWGYKIMENNHVIRAYNGGLYKIKQINNLILYSQKDYGSDFFDSIYYFSFNLDSEIHIADKSTIKKVFADNPCVLHKLAFAKLWQYPSDWNGKYNTIRFMVWYNECNMKK
jgi:hypothetical protein